MSLLPWDNWFYHLPYKRNEVNNLHTQAVALQNQIQAQIDVFNGNLSLYQSLVAGNSALVIVANTIKMKDLDYKDFTTKVDAIEPPPVGFVPVSIAGLIDELAGGTMVLKAIWQLGKFTKNLVSGGGEEGSEAIGETALEDLAEASAEAGVEAGAEEGTEITAETVGETVAETAAETAIEGASLAGLGSIGIGIFAAVGIDLIFGAINGAKESSALDNEIDKLQSALNKCQTYYNTVMSNQAKIDGGIVGEEKRFTGLIGALVQVGQEQPSFKYSYNPTVANASQFMGAMRQALSEYGLYVRIRQAWQQAVDRNPQVTKEQFIEDYLMFAPSNVTEDLLTNYWKVLATYSDNMKAQN